MHLTDKIFRKIVELSPFPVYVCTGKEMIITVANEATLKAWGRDNSVIGKPFPLALPELHNQPFTDLIRQVLATGETYYSKNDRADLFVDGRLQTFYFKFTYQPLHNEENEIESVLCFATDVTELERSRQEVEKNREILYNMIHQAPVGICIIAREELIVQVANESYLEVVGRKREDLENKPIWLAVPEVKDLYGPVLSEVFNTGVSFRASEHEVPLVRNGRSENVYLDFVYEPITDINGEITSVMVIAIDVTEKVLSRRKIEEAEERARLAIEAAEIGTFAFNIITNEVKGSDRFRAIFGYTEHAEREQLVARFHPDDLEGRRLAHEASLITGKLLYEARVIWEDQSVRWVRINGKLDFRNNKPVRILGTVLDITEFKQLQQQKDDFISVASHELKTPMTTVKASMQVLERLVSSEPGSDRVPQFVGKVNTSLNKMQHLVESLLNVSRITAGQFHLNYTRFRLADLISDCCDYITMTGDYTVQLSGELDAEVFADRYKLDQVVNNLINNAVKYAPQSKLIRIHLENCGDFLRLEVQDFGPGIPETKVPHLFDQYYRADSSGYQYSGLGLGLYICADIIKRHKGEIGVESKEGMGSKFWFTLPVL
ncbi:PAS domain-containing sensor histidine kinase [Desertivirga arenae]|uniref:PAS domain-containing sensor histidine kinase n=1 Tax=Desertivirga arenae TaxID=2810309 RepID=UPI001A95DA55|nr:ATP-binding protein [Pedobacter sp. SYSU D00823]